MKIQLFSEDVGCDISRLQERRETIFRNLEGLRMAIENLIGKTPDLAENLEPFLLIGERLPWDAGTDAGKLEAQRLAFGVWLGRQEASFKVKPEKAAEALGFVPGEVSEVVAAWAAYDHTRSSEPGRYWSPAKQRFRALPVTAEEKETIAARAVLEFHSEEAAAAFHSIRQQANLINFLNRTANAATEITPGVLQAQFPLLVRTLKLKKAGNVPLVPRQYYPNFEIFGSFPDRQACFDE